MSMCIKASLHVCLNSKTSNILKLLDTLVSLMLICAEGAVGSPTERAIHQALPGKATGLFQCACHLKDTFFGATICNLILDEAHVPWLRYICVCTALCQNLVDIGCSTLQSSITDLSLYDPYCMQASLSPLSDFTSGRRGLTETSYG